MGSAEVSTALIVPAECAQEIRFDLEKMKLWDATYKLKRLTASGNVAVPIDISNGNVLAITNKWPDFKIARIHLPMSKKVKIKQNSPVAILQSEIKCLLRQYGMSEKLLDEVPTKWERHGDLVIIPPHAFSSPEWSLIGSNLWQVVAKCLASKRLAQNSAVANDGFRSSKVMMLLGDNGEVTHVDNGIKYSYDVTKCMFSAGNITEKMRVAALNCINETVVDLYAGIGYFTLPYLVHAKAQHVHACEWNPNAAVALKRNLLINGVSEKCTVHEGDNRLLELPPLADRINLGLIPSSEQGWPVAVQVLKQCGGILHIHGNVTTNCQQRRLLESPDHVCAVLHRRNVNSFLGAEKGSEGHLLLCSQKDLRNVSIAEKSEKHISSCCQEGQNKYLSIKEQSAGEDKLCQDCRSVRIGVTHLEKISDSGLSREATSGTRLSQECVSNDPQFSGHVLDCQLSREDISESQLSREDISESQLSREDISESQLSREDISESQLSREHVSNYELSRKHVTAKIVSSQQPDLGSQQPDLGSQQSDLGSQQPDLGSQQPDLGSQQPDLSPQQLDLGSQQRGLSPQQPDLGSQQPYLRLQQPDLSPQQPDLSPHQPELDKPQPDLSPQQPDLRLQRAESTNTISHHRNCEHRNVKSERRKHIPSGKGLKTADVMSGGCSLVSLPNVAENLNGHNLFEPCQKWSGKGQIISACQEWSIYVQRQFKCLLEAKKGGIWEVKELHVEVVKSYAPHVVHAVLDLECRPVECRGGLE